jgi:hypothetical protein
MSTPAALAAFLAIRGSLAYFTIEEDINNLFIIYYFFGLIYKIYIIIYC